jgi:hypothetical protein
VRCSEILTGFKVQRHGLSNDPSNNDQERSNEKGDLDAGSDGDTHGKVHLIAYSDNHCRNVFRSISNDRNQDQTNECFADTGAFHDVIDTSDKVLGTNCDEKSGDHKDTSGRDRANDGFLSLGLFFALFNVTDFGIEKIAVSSELENKVQNIKQKEDNGSSAGQNQDASGLLITITDALVQNGVQLRSSVSKILPAIERRHVRKTYCSRDDEGSGRQGHERAGSLCNRSGEALL